MLNSKGYAGRLSIAVFCLTATFGSNSIALAAQTMQKARAAIHAGMSDSEILELRSEISKARYDEDQIYLHGAAQSSTPETIYKSLQAGDVLLIRSSSLTGSLAARAPDSPGQYSHLIFVAQDPSTLELQLIASDQGKGVSISKLELSEIDHWARVALLRYKDSDVARKAATELANYVIEKEKAVKIPYDNRMNLDDHSSIYCTEVATIAFNILGVKVPENLSHVSFLTDDLQKKLDISTAHIFTPQDLEIDSRFSLIAEYRNVNDLQEIYKVDALFGKYFEWVRAGKEEISPNIFGKLASFIGTTFFRKKVAEAIGADSANKKGISNFLKYAVSVYSTVDNYSNKLKEELRFEKTKYFTVADYERTLEEIYSRPNQMQPKD